MRYSLRNLFLAAVILALLMYFVISPLNEARRMAEYSAQMALFKEAEHLLEEYRAAHGEYPKTLDSLKFTFPDGGDRSTLALLKYESDGKTYTLVTKDVYSGEEIRKSP
jgi:type II secretory pathway pseudopilin PulG